MLIKGVHETPFGTTDVLFIKHYDVDQTMKEIDFLHF